ncbi:MAG TPA: efflux RND transporter periplasmic adaptor subunit [Candidatus Nitrosotalea sp.]|jgi:membrane fusion protein (multidrug efflux system)|nr:efflux RND transporter periplasmic adaptor subunit [Candidatus Nitrosotalea sp.]
MRLLRRHRVGLVLLGLLVLIAFLVVYRFRDQQARAVTRARPDVLVGVLSPVRRDLDVRLAFTADILPVQQAAIFSKVSGYIRRIHADRGDFVKTGQLLVEIDDLELQAAVQQARASLLTGEAGLEVARSTLDGQRANLENQRANLTKARAVAENDARQAQRLKTLFERGLVSATDYENSRTNAESSAASVRAAEAQLRVAEVSVTTQESQVRLAQAQVETYRAALQLAQTSLANTRLVAPFTGYISQRNLDNGAAVSAQSAGTSTTSVGILMVQDIESVKVQIEVPERDIARVAVGAPVTIRADPYQGQTFAGRVVRVVHSLDARTRTMGVEVDIPNADRKLKPGMFARVEVLVDTRRGVLTLPVEALRVGEARPSVMVVRNGVVEPVVVELGLSDSQVIEIRQGLGEQDQVILQGKDLVKAKQKVRTVPATGQ